MRTETEWLLPQESDSGARGLIISDVTPALERMFSPLLLAQYSAQRTKSRPLRRKRDSEARRAYLREYQREWRKRNRIKSKAILKKSNEKRMAGVRREIGELKSRPCMDCGSCFPPICMDFDHREGEIKRESVSQMATSSNTYSVAAIRAEMAKCDVVCSNCHRIRTAERRERAKVRQGG